MLFVHYGGRFAQFFIAPLFNPDGTDREMKAVDSEHKKNILSDAWRIMQIERTSSNPKHPYSKFGTGCLETSIQQARNQRHFTQIS